MNSATAVFLLVVGSAFAQERSISGGGSRSSRFTGFTGVKSKPLGFNCPEDFGYYPHPSECSQYYVCVFGGALLESCTGGLMYSNELQTCDWPRNVKCERTAGPGITTVKIIDPRTLSRNSNQVLSATESLPTSSNFIRGIDNAIRTRDTQKITGSSKSIFDDSNKLRQGRFVFGQGASQDINSGFQAQETSSRAFNVVAVTPKSRAVFPPSIPGVSSSSNRFAQAPTAAPVIDQSLYNDLLNLTDNDYYYYYDDLLYDDYYEPTSQVATTARSAALRSSSSRSQNSKTKRVNSISPPATVATSSSPSSRRGGGSRVKSSTSPSLSPFESSFNSSPSSRFSGTISSSSSGTLARNNGDFPSINNGVKKSRSSSTKNSSSRGSSQAKSQTSQSGSPEVVGRTPHRPAPVYPQPPVDTPAEICDRTVCQLPDCYCGGGPVPGNIPPQNVPQMVLLTFDDSVNDLNKKLYIDLFEQGRVNPNGCPIAATFYVSHEWTDYSQVQNLYSDGHEIASHSITHSFGEQFSAIKWAKEVGGQREILSAYGGVHTDDVRGMRAPFLAIGGNNMFRMLYELNFTYDSSMPVYENRPPSWPYTLDYKVFHDCMIPPCPTNSYPGVWQVPMVMWQDLTGGRCSMADACTTPPDAEGVYKMLIKNFERHYTSNRSPLGLYYHAAWFTTPHHKEGFIAFLDTIAAMDDVWIITSWQSLQWMRNPVPLSQAKSFKPFQCDYPERPPRCTNHRVCNVWHKGSVRYLKTCQKCPESYPWVGNTGVKSPLNDI